VKVVFPTSFAPHLLAGLGRSCGEMQRRRAQAAAGTSPLRGAPLMT
jgi:hypothetical protein